MKNVFVTKDNCYVIAHKTIENQYKVMGVFKETTDGCFQNDFSLISPNSVAIGSIKFQRAR